MKLNEYQDCGAENNDKKHNKYEGVCNKRLIEWVEWMGMSIIFY